MSTSNPAPRRAMINTRVELELITEKGAREPLVIQLADDSAANIDEGWIGLETPLGRAIRGQPEGAQIAYRMGDIRSLRIVRVSDVDAPPPADAVERRQAILDEARRKAERTEQEMFSSSYTGKWGGYSAEDLSDAE